MEGQPSELSKSEWAKRLRSEGRTGRPSYQEGAHAHAPRSIEQPS